MIRDRSVIGSGGYQLGRRENRSGLLSNDQTIARRERIASTPLWITIPFGNERHRYGIPNVTGTKTGRRKKEG